MEERLNLFVDRELKQDLELYARANRTSVSAVLREAASEYLAARTNEPADLSDLCGWYDGSPDASTTIDEAVYGRPKRA